MTTTHRASALSSPSTGSRTATSASTSAAADRSVLMDLLAISPSATLGRALVGILIAVLQPAAVVAAVMVGVVGLVMIGRLVAGFALRGYSASLRGER
jgi:hypothetical protein